MTNIPRFLIFAIFLSLALNVIAARGGGSSSSKAAGGSTRSRKSSLKSTTSECACAPKTDVAFDPDLFKSYKEDLIFSCTEEAIKDANSVTVFFKEDKFSSNPCQQMKALIQGDIHSDPNVIKACYHENGAAKYLSYFDRSKGKLIFSISDVRGAPYLTRTIENEFQGINDNIKSPTVSYITTEGAEEELNFTKGHILPFSMTDSSCLYATQSIFNYFSSAIALRSTIPCGGNCPRDTSNMEEQLFFDKDIWNPVEVSFFETSGRAHRIITGLSDEAYPGAYTKYKVDGKTYFAETAKYVWKALPYFESDNTKPKEMIFVQCLNAGRKLVGQPSCQFGESPKVMTQKFAMASPKSLSTLKSVCNAVRAFKNSIVEIEQQWFGNFMSDVFGKRILPFILCHVKILDHEKLFEISAKRTDDINYVTEYLENYHPDIYQNVGYGRIGHLVSKEDPTQCLMAFSTLFPSFGPCNNDALLIVRLNGEIENFKTGATIGKGIDSVEMTETFQFSPLQGNQLTKSLLESRIKSIEFTEFTSSDAYQLMSLYNGEYSVHLSRALLNIQLEIARKLDTRLVNSILMRYENIAAFTNNDERIRFIRLVQTIAPYWFKLMKFKLTQKPNEAKNMFEERVKTKIVRHNNILRLFLQHATAQERNVIKGDVEKLCVNVVHDVKLRQREKKAYLFIYQVRQEVCEGFGMVFPAL